MANPALSSADRSAAEGLVLRRPLGVGRGDPCAVRRRLLDRRGSAGCYAPL